MTVKKTILSVAAVAMIAGFVASPMFAQTDAPPSAHKVGLIDMAHIFKNYKKFDALREDLKQEITKSDTQAKQMKGELKKLDDELKQMKQGSAGYTQKEKQLLQANSELQAFVNGAQRDFLRKESQIYKTIYLEVTDAVNKYAQHYQYTLIIRFAREEVEETNEPQDVMARMNRQVVYYRDEHDITNPVLKFLNKNYSADEPAPKPAPRVSDKTKPAAK